MATTPTNEVNELAGQSIRRARKAKGLSQADVARHLGEGYHQQTIAKMERGRRNIGVNEIVALAGIFDIPVGDLLPPRRTVVFEHFVTDWTRRSQPLQSVCGKVWRPDPDTISTERCPDCLDIVGSMWSK